MTTHIVLNTGRIEEIAREVENENVSSVAELAERVGLKFEEFAALVGELIASRKVSETGGMRITLRGDSDAQGVRGYYRRFKWKFHAEVGSPQIACTENEMKEAAQRVIGFVMDKIGRDFEQAFHEMKTREADAEQRRKELEAAAAASSDSVN